MKVLFLILLISFVVIAGSITAVLLLIRRHRMRASDAALRRELEALSGKLDMAWISKAAEGFDVLHARTRRNINRSLGLDAVAISLTRPTSGTKNSVRQ